MPNGQAQTSGDQRGNNVGLSYSQIIQEITTSPSPLQAGLHEENIWERERMVRQWVKSNIDAYFMTNKAAARNFDLLYSTPDKDYQTSWQKLSQISSRLPSLMDLESHVEFSQIWRQILDGVRAAIRKTEEANALIFFWRICREFLDMQPTGNAHYWFGNKLPIDFLLATILEETKNDQKGLPYLLNRLVAVVYRAPRDEVTRLLERGYFQAIQQLRISWNRQTFTIPQMETNYLIRWHVTPSHFWALISEYEKLILHAIDNFNAGDERIFIFRHQFLFFLSRCKQDPGIIRCTAKCLYKDARQVLENRQGFPWDGVSNSLGFAARTLTTVHGQTLLRDVPENVRQNAIDKGFAYPIDAYNILSRGNDECRRQAELLLRDFGGES
ncbi:uncharacterized protein Z519_07780 [Cladophialophora bantiana CBS 173.52]|uniref:Clr5 domain-containing protein n=1 Tax=Cladophialophora bantiana (strain ATCC 10958 / CBS 173.52 / CDC B-1940 / NIH 8579) TaxID=1442370 RepID=A0A0D2HLY4_CLAB1|nr:uncharacterized protein Z519_07780 [Cladophialophora bantiana CBS 173.52]KIW91810.1 hypothetical protein Z519_07780 [Cladophialophora bantiana CBS 173.52]